MAKLVGDLVSATVRLGVYSQWYDPEPGPASLPAVYARLLAARGHSVRVLTGYPNYPIGKLYPGYTGRRPMVEYREGIPVHRVPLIPSHSGSALGRVANYLSFAGSATVLGARDLGGVDALWVYNSPATVGLPLLLRRAARATPFLLHVQDLWPESVLHSGMLPAGRAGAVAERLLRRLVERIERAADHIAVISPSVADLLTARGVPADKISYVPNPTDETLFHPRDRRADIRRLIGGADGDFLLMYAGSLGQVQALDTVIDAMGHLRNHPQIKLVFVGTGIAETGLQDQVTRLALTSVRFHGRVPAGDVPDLMAAADAQLVSLRDDPFLAMTTPSKISAILGSAQPVVGVLTGDGADVIDQAGAGVVCPPGDAADLAATILRFAERGPAAWRATGECGLAHYQRHMSAARTAENVERLLMRMAAQ